MAEIAALMNVTVERIVRAANVLDLPNLRLLRLIPELDRVWQDIAVRGLEEALLEPAVPPRQIAKTPAMVMADVA
jgi:hypothetical protein